MLAQSFRNFSTIIKSRFVKFFDKLRKSKSEEVRILSELVGRDMGSTTGKNLALLERETGMNPWSSPSWKVSAKLDSMKAPVPVQDIWRLDYLGKLLRERYRLSKELQQTKQIDALIESLCIN